MADRPQPKTADVKPSQRVLQPDERSCCHITVTSTEAPARAVCFLFFSPPLPARKDLWGRPHASGKEGFRERRFEACT